MFIKTGHTLSRKFTVLKSFEEVAPYIYRAQEGADAERDALGFLPPNAYRQAGEQGKLFVAVNAESEFLGHLWFGGVFPHGKVMQIYTVPHYRNQGIAQALIEELIDHAQNRSFLSLSAKVASDLSRANAFYGRMGFQIVGTLSGGKTRDRLIYRRVRDLDTPSLFDLMAPGDREHVPSLGISGGYESKTPIYAIDLNVLFDVSKQRVRGEDAGLVFNAGFRNDIRPVIAEEFIEELQRSSENFPADPHLQIALQMPGLPMPKRQDVTGIEAELAGVIFPERNNQGILTAQDKSDLKHLATAIHHKVAGFITSENAILRAHDYLQFKYGLDVLGVSDFADIMSSDENDLEPKQIVRSEGTELSFSPLTDAGLNDARKFLDDLHVPSQTRGDALDLGDSISSQKHIILIGQSGIISFASWSVTKTPRKCASVFLCADEVSPAAKVAIEHTLERVCREASAGAPVRIRLHILPGHPVTRKLGLAHGFRPEPGQEEYGTILHKVAIGGVLDERSWEATRRSLKSLARAELPSSIPRFKSADQRIQIKTSSGEVVIVLQDLETLLSPALFLLPERPGVVVPIKRVFAEELLGTGRQFSLLSAPEAVLLKERVYYCTPRAEHLLVPGTIILFYESSARGGSKSIIAAGRVKESRILTVDEVNSDTRRRGVLRTDTFKHIGTSSRKLAITFDNIMAFENPVSLDRLREIGCVDRANFVTAKRIEPDQVISIIHEGLKNE